MTKTQRERSDFAYWAGMFVRRFPQLKLMYYINSNKPYFPDYCLPVSKCGYHGLYLTFVTEQNNDATEDQKHWIEDLHECGYAAEMCYDAIEATEVITKYLKGEYK